jgi:hypothetical protein
MKYSTLTALNARLSSAGRNNSNEIAAFIRTSDHIRREANAMSFWLLPPVGYRNAAHPGMARNGCRQIFTWR